MEDLKALQLFQEVLTETKAGRIKWEPTASESEYFSVLPGGFTIAVRTWDERDDWGTESPQLALVLRSGEQELLRVTADVDGVGWRGLTELFESARRRALNVDAAVDKLLGELSKL